jgi:hypothetical protein
MPLCRLLMLRSAPRELSDIRPPPSPHKRDRSAYRRSPHGHCVAVLGLWQALHDGAEFEASSKCGGRLREP